MITPVKDNRLKQILKEILEIYLKDTAQARVLCPDGSYKRLRDKVKKEELFSAQDFFAERGY